jgi:SAM-dependent methyltransferase
LRRSAPTSGGGIASSRSGGGSGYQAAALASWGCRVYSIDLADRPRTAKSHHLVVDYDGHRMPFRDGSFDVAFSSNVLEHVAEMPQLLREIRRVLRRDGLAVHVVPSAAWRFWTMVAHYGYLGRASLGHGTMPGAVVVPSAAAVARRRGLGYLLRRVMFPGPHGVSRSAMAELLAFSRWRWRQAFEAAGFAISDRTTTGLFYTGYTLCPGLTLSVRRRLARWLGSACHVFVTRPVGEQM